MKAIHRKILELSLPYQDKRDDKGHARTVTDFAIMLLKTERADPDVVIPAAILHDIGWSKMPKKERFGPVKSKKIGNKETGSLRRKHEKLGA